MQQRRVFRRCQGPCENGVKPCPCPDACYADGKPDRLIEEHLDRAQAARGQTDNLFDLLSEKGVIEKVPRSRIAIPRERSVIWPHVLGILVAFILFFGVAMPILTHWLTS